MLIIQYVLASKETLGTLGKSNNLLKYHKNEMILKKSFKSSHVSHN